MAAAPSDQSFEWELRARGYAALAARWPLLETIADRTVGALPPELEGRVLDLGTGSGRSAARLVALRPRVRLVLAEPSPTMLVLARGRLGGRVVEAQLSRAEDLALTPGSLTGAISCAAFHMVEPRAALARLGSALQPGARFACHLWGHTWAPLAGVPERTGWRAALREALAELGEDVALVPPPRAPVVRDEACMRAAADAAELDLCEVEVARDTTRDVRLLELAATSPALLAPLAASRRAAVLAGAAQRLGDAEVEIASAQLVFERRP